jgi:hypothetical protein
MLRNKSIAYIFINRSLGYRLATNRKVNASGYYPHLGSSVLARRALLPHAISDSALPLDTVRPELAHRQLSAITAVNPRAQRAVTRHPRASEHPQQRVSRRPKISVSETKRSTDNAVRNNKNGVEYQQRVSPTAMHPMPAADCGMNIAVYNLHGSAARQAER